MKNIEIEDCLTIISNAFSWLFVFYDLLMIKQKVPKMKRTQLGLAT